MLEKRAAGYRIGNPDWAWRILSAQKALAQFDPRNKALGLATVHPNSVVDFSPDFEKRFPGDVATAVNNYVSHLINTCEQDGVLADTGALTEPNGQRVLGFGPPIVGGIMREVYGNRHYKIG